MKLPTASSRRGLHAAALAAVTPLMCFAAPATADAASSPLTWAFDKCASAPGTWEGTVSGPSGGTEPLRTVLTDIRISSEVLHVEFDWEVGDAFVAHLAGTLNPATGDVVMNGQVAEGAYTGSQVHEEGQLSDAARSCFTGTIRVMPAS